MNYPSKHFSEIFSRTEKSSLFFSVFSNDSLGANPASGVHRDPGISCQMPLRLLLRHSRVNEQRLHAEFLTHGYRILSVLCQRWRRPERTGIRSDRSVHLFLQRSRCLCRVTKDMELLSSMVYKHGATEGEDTSRHVQHANLPSRAVLSSASSVSVRAAVQRSLKISKKQRTRWWVM